MAEIHSKNSMHLAVVSVTARRRGAVCTADRLDAELRCRGTSPERVIGARHLLRSVTDETLSDKAVVYRKGNFFVLDRELYEDVWPFFGRFGIVTVRGQGLASTESLDAAIGVISGRG